MKGPLLLLLLLLTTTTTTFPSVDATIEEVCDKATKGSEYYGYCVSTLKSASKDGDQQGFEGLAAVATELAKSNYDANIAKIQELLKKDQQGGLSEVSSKALAACSKVYELGLSKMQQAARCLGQKDYYGAANYLSTARDEAVSCGDTFEKLGIEPLMRSENDEALKLSYLAIHISQNLVES